MFSPLTFWLLALRLELARRCPLPDVAPWLFYRWPEYLRDEWGRRYFDAFDVGQIAVEHAH